MKFFLTVLLGAMLSATSLPTYAYDEARAGNNFAHEAAECAAYYMIGSVAPGLGQETSQSFMKAAAVLLELSESFTSRELAKARFLLATESMKRDMGKNWSNVSIILQKHGYFCKDFSDKPVARFSYWLDKQD